MQMLWTRRSITFAGTDLTDKNAIFHWNNVNFEGDKTQMSLVMRKPAFCICEYKDADQLRGNREPDQRLCFR